MNPIYAAMNNSRPNMMQMLQQLKSNPSQFLMRTKFNIPANVINNPEAVVQHLLSTNQVSQDAVNRAYSMARQLGGK